MLMIREEQLKALQEAAMRGFHMRMVAHLRAHFPEECRRAGEERMLGAIKQGIFRAGKYAITSERDVARYIDLSVVLGLDFDSGRRHAWAKEILENKELDAEDKLEQLFDRTMEIESARQPSA